MNIFDTLPNDIKIKITCYLDFKNEEWFDCRLVNKDYKKLMDKNITIQGYPDLDNCSFFAFTKDYHEYIEHMRQQRLEAERNFQMFYRAMLLDFGWI